MDRSSLLLSIPAAAILFLCSCATSTQEYALEAQGFSVTKGRIEKVERLTTDRNEHLKDGLAVTVSNEPCNVTMKMGDNSLVFTLVPGSLVVFGEDGDFLLQPQASQPPAAQPAPAPAPAPVPAPAPPAAK